MNLKRTLRRWYHRFHNWYWNIRTRIIAKPHMLHMKGISAWHWTDTDEKLFEAVCQLMKNFVERELAPGGYRSLYKKEMPHNVSRDIMVKCVEKHWEWETNLTLGEVDCANADGSNADELLPQAITAKKLREVYFWYTEEYPREKNRIENLWETHDDDVLKQEMALEEKKTQICCEILQIRQGLWT